MDNISELIQQNKSEFDEKFKIMSIGYHKCEGWNDIDELEIDTGYIDNIQEVFDWHTQSLKDLIDAVIEDEEEAIFDRARYVIPDYGDGFNASKQDTISKLKAIREML
jgi:hypothetical protein